MKPSTVLLFAEYQVRKSKNQKISFIQQACSAAANARYTSNVVRTRSGARNIIVGDLEKAAVVYTAHYDTPSRSLLPGFVFPTAPALTVLYQMAVALAVLIPAFIVYFAASLIFGGLGISPAVTVLLSLILAMAAFVAAMILFVSGPPCKNNANANTSGVAALFEIMAEIPEELHDYAAFVFFDEQENGCIGSREFAKKNKRKLGKKLVVNFDCIGIGDEIVIATRPGVKKELDFIKEAFDEERGFAVSMLKGGNRIPSDHNNFKHGVGISAFKRSKTGMLYADGMCSDNDELCEEKNLNYIIESAIKLVKIVLENTRAEALVPEHHEDPALEGATEIAEPASESQSEEAVEAPAEAEANAEQSKK